MQDAIELKPLPCRDDAAWHSANSWFGGQPTLSPDLWPREEHGTPLHFLAQIAMSDLPAGSWPAGLPESGTLLFFGDTDLEDGEPDCAVIHVATPEAFAPCPPPEDTPPLYGKDWNYYIREARSEAAVPRSFGRWPLQATVVSETPAEKTERASLFDMKDLVPFNRHGVFMLDGCLRGIEQHQANLPDRIAQDEENAARLRQAVKPVGTGAKIVSLLGFRSQRDQAESARVRKKLEQAEKTLDSRKTQLARMRAEGPGLIAELEQHRQRLDALDPVDRMSEEDEKMLLGISQRTRDFSALGSVNLQNVRVDAVMNMATEDRDLFRRLPQQIRDWVDDHCGLGWSGDRIHQMFGEGLSVQGAVEAHADKVMLAQFNSDMRLRWLWGDVGVLQVWIDPQDMAAGRWDKAFMTFEGH